MGANGPKRRDGTGAKPAARGPAGGKVGHAVPVGHAAPLSPGAPPLRRSFDIPSDFAASRDVQDAVMADVAARGFDEESAFAIRISLEEAVVNAIRHGNKFDVAKRVRVESVVSDRTAEISVEDEGPGFDRGHIPDPTAEENLCRPNGRGILLIESYMNAVRWEQNGRRVHMTKHAASPVVAVPVPPGA
ncbi:MAG: anti-sigma regulatory factor [Phycisphaerales bacterium]|nr:anti-sigma regulatory factor [Phycisphaerales bacterium]